MKPRTEQSSSDWISEREQLFTNFSTLLPLFSLFFQPYYLCLHYFFNPTTLVVTICSTLLPLSSLFFQSYYLCLHYFFNPTTFGSRHSARQDNNDQEHRRQNLNQNDAQSARAESTHEGVNWHSKDNYKDLSHLRSLSPGM